MKPSALFETLHALIGQRVSELYRAGSSRTEWALPQGRLSLGGQATHEVRCEARSTSHPEWRRLSGHDVGGRAGLLLTPGEFGRVRVNLQASHQVFCYVPKTHCRRTTSSGTRGEAGAGRVQLCNRSRPLTATRRMRIQQQIHCRRWSTQRLGLSRPASYRRQQPASQALAFAAKP